jgi:adenosylcobinamide-GDP ribazoletransferase
MLLAPAVGALLAVVLVPVALGVDRLTSGPPLLPAALAVALLALLTRGLHLDGLADLADGLGSYRSPEQARAVMKAPDVGALGLAAVVLVLLVQVAALSACLSAGRGGTALLVALLTARVAVAAACRAGVPPAAPHWPARRPSRWSRAPPDRGWRCPRWPWPPAWGPQHSCSGTLCAASEGSPATCSGRWSR